VNFRLPPERARAVLPPGLEPLLVDGSAVASTCVLQIDRVLPGPLALPLGHASSNCAHRIAVTHRATGEPGVYVHRRNTASRLVSACSSLGCPGHHRHLDLSIRSVGDGWDVAMSDSAPLLRFRALPAPNGSRLFPSTADFDRFIAAGVRSWAPATLPGRLVVVDLAKESNGGFAPLALEGLVDTQIADWLGAPAASAFDSAYLTTGGAYTWHYIGID
jgi:hypothetical protein